MSTDWIKMRVDLRTHPKVVRMASALRADKLRVIGGLFAVWAIFDAHSGDGVLEGYTFRAIDDELNWKGFAQAMSSIDWLIDAEGAGLMAPRFEEHNGQSAKRRAMETERKRLEREAEKQAQIDRAMSACDADKSVTREEKSREEEIQEEPNGSRRQADPRLPNCPQDQIVSLYHEQLPELPAVRLQSDARQKAMRGFWRWVLTSKKSDGQPRANDADQALTWISSYFERARGNDFLMGRTARNGAHAGWVCDFDFLLTEKGRKQVIEKTVDTV